jgi:GR25 family glycosyltransferase involved in LPS biosynthesis
MRVFLITTSQDTTPPSWLSSAADVDKVTIVNSFDLRRAERSKALSFIDQDQFLFRYGALPSNGAIGCAAAHRACYDQILREKLPNALILEDDVKIVSSNLTLIRELMENLKDFDVLNLASLDSVVAKRPTVQFGNVSAHRSLWYSHGTYAYVVTSSGSRRLLRSQSPLIKGYADWPIHAWMMRQYLAMPGLVSHSDRPSDVQTSGHCIGKASFSQRCVYLSRRAIWKSIGLVRLRLLSDIKVQGI